MPRPGPRPYECIRRAWHSDSHQPLRGALIQEIFRVVNDIHSTSTRRKKEWQEKLPIVVLRAEEILYSKANSENEYADVETLRGRLDDAVNTMIRREESEEDGVFLAPCVEAALALGCTPKKIPRGQRQSSSRFLSNGSKRNNSMSSANPVGCRSVPGNSTAATINHVDSVSLSAQQCSSTVFSSIRKFPIQEQPNLPPSSMVSCMSSSLVSSPFFTPNAGLIPSQNQPFHSPLEAAHSMVASALPDPGGLVQFLRSADGGKSPCLPRCNTNYVLPQLQFNANPEPRALQVDAIRSVGSRLDAHFPCGDLGSLTNASYPMSSVSRLLQETSRLGYAEPNHQVRHTYGTGVCTDINSASDNNLLQPTCLPLPSFSSLPDACLPPQVGVCHNFSGTASIPPQSSAVDGMLTQSQMRAYDLQLRLAPPGREPDQVPSGDSSISDIRRNSSSILSGARLAACPASTMSDLGSSTAKRMKLEVYNSDVSSMHHYEKRHSVKF